MSHINDLIGVVRGLRLVAEAGVKLQQEHSRIIWSNSSFGPVLSSCPTNILTTRFKPSSDSAKEMLDRALVVAHGFRKYAQMHIPTYSTEVEKSLEMDPNLRHEIEELNREFNKTFETLDEARRSSRDPDETPAQFVPSAAPFVAPAAPNVAPEVQIMRPTSGANQAPVEVNISANNEKSKPKPVARKKVSSLASH